jgi:prepilin-type N-terminal cleavage/methylation domain-containing protein
MEGFLMRFKEQGFSLIEVLISLLVVSMMAVGITGLQQKVSAQQANNIAHATAISMMTLEMEEILGINYIEQLLALNDRIETDLQGANTTFSILIEIKDVMEDFNAGGDFKDVILTISWLDNQGNQNEFTHSRTINAALLLSNGSENKNESSFSTRITSILVTDKIIYFDPNKSYKSGDFVIHDSYLYQATSNFLVHGEAPYIVSINSENKAIANDGWTSIGQIDDPELKNNEHLASLFFK